MYTRFVFLFRALHLDLHSFPTRRSSDLGAKTEILLGVLGVLAVSISARYLQAAPAALPRPARTDRKSTRLNSSHTVMSYAVFCLKKKKPAALSAASRPLIGGSAFPTHCG